MALGDNPVFKAVKEHADHMLEYGRGPLDEAPPPLFASIVDPLDREPKTHQVAPPPGIRLNDFSWAGNNLMHDIPFLETLIALTRITGEPAYEQAVDQALAFYVKHCPHPDTGLFPWGEHAQWSFVSRRILGNACHDPFAFVQNDMVIHEHLRFAPAWFWDRVWRADADAVVRFAHGLDWHIMNPETMEHNRHAPMNGRHWNEIPYRGQGKDFARHAGMFIFDCAFAYARSGDPSLLEWARRKIAYHLEHRHANGILTGCVRTKSEAEEGQHDSFACSIYDAAQVLGLETAAGREFLGVAEELFDARRRQGGSARGAEDGDVDIAAAWNWGYGAQRPAWGGGHVAAQVLERSGLQAYADAIARAADQQSDVAPPWEDRPVVTWAFAVNLENPLNAYAITGEPKYLEQATHVARWALDRVAPTGLFLGVINMEYFFNINTCYSVAGCFGKKAERPGYYFSGTGVPTLVRNLLRLALLQEGEEDILGVDPHAR